MPGAAEAVGAAYRLPARSPAAHRVWREAQVAALARSSRMEPLRLVGGVVLAADLAVVAVSGAAASALRFGLTSPPPGVLAAVVFALLLMLRMAGFEATPRPGAGENRSPENPVPGPTLRSVPLLRGAGAGGARWCITLATLLLAAFLTRTSTDFARLWAAIWFALGLCGLCANRVLAVACLRRWRRRGRLARIVAVVDLDGKGAAIAHRLRRRAAEEVRVIGVFAAGPDAPPRRGIEDLIALSARFRIDDVLVGCSGEEPGLASSCAACPPSPPPCGSARRCPSWRRAGGRRRRCCSTRRRWWCAAGRSQDGRLCSSAPRICCWARCCWSCSPCRCC